MKLTRRDFLAASAASAALPGRSRAQGNEDPIFLIVVGGTGGASMTDSLLARHEGEVEAPASLAVYPQSAVRSVEDSPFRAVQWSSDGLGPIPIPFAADQQPFVAKRKSEILVATVEGTSVNHAVGQKRSVTGNDAWGGRTLQEACAAHYGAGLPLPNVHLATGTGFTEAGVDDRVPTWARGQTVADPKTWPLGLHGSKGIGRSALMEGVQALRRRFEDAGRFAPRFPEQLDAWRGLRSEASDRLEAAGLIDQLLFADAAFGDFGLRASPDAERVRDAFPNYDADPLDAQGALAFLLLKNRASVTVTIAPTFSAVLEEGGLREGALTNPPIAFDFSHQSHRGTQAVMWSRLFSVMDRLIGLLEREPFGGGQSLWDRSVMYVPTEFGRTKLRPEGATEFGSGHDLSNAVMVLSPRLRGNRVLGGVDPRSLRTRGWDRISGASRPDATNPEADIYGGVLELLRIPDSGLSVPAFRA
ncbi:MAG: hypothetical protein AAF627_13805 [Myxococcota bacterium]